MNFQLFPQDLLQSLHLTLQNIVNASLMIKVCLYIVTIDLPVLRRVTARKYNQKRLIIIDRLYTIFH